MFIPLRQTVFAYFKSLQNLIFQSHHRIHQLNVTSSIGTKVTPQDPMTDEQVIMELRRRSRHRGHQIVGYRRKLMQQVNKKRVLTVYSFHHMRVMII